jgi:hypothetical protein
MVKKNKTTNLLALLVLAFLTAWASKGLFKYSYYQTHDLDHHLVRSLDAFFTLKEGHFPLRWAGILNFGCGTPIYNFFNPLYYYLSPIFIAFLGNIIDSIKAISLLSLFFGSLFIYLWLKKETKNSLAALTSALVYLYAPYRFVLVYVRGSPEYLAYAVAPAIFYFYCLALDKNNKKPIFYFFLASFSGGLLSISHNVVFLLAVPVIAIYLISKLITTKANKKKIYLTIFSFVSIFGLGAFFLIPAFLEQKFTQIATPVFLYKDHFPILKQLISSPWGYGDSASDVSLDAMSFRLGIAHWLTLVASIVYLIVTFSIRRSKYFLERNLLIISFAVMALLFIFLDLPISNFVWKKLTILQAIQFPWRILGIIVLVTSTLTGLLVSKIKLKAFSIIILIGFSSLAVFENRNHLLAQPVHKDKLEFYQNLSDLKFNSHSVTQVQDNVLATGKLAQCSPETPIAITETGQILDASEVERKSSRGKISLNIEKGDIVKEKIIINFDYFPNIFDIDVNGNQIEYFDCQGRICLSTKSFLNGENTIAWKIVQSPIQKMSNVISLLFIFIWLTVLYRNYKLN